MRSNTNLYNVECIGLKNEGLRFEEDTIYLSLSIPNKEVRYIYRTTIREWFERQTKSIDFTPFYQAILAGDCDCMQRVLKENLRRTISYYDNKEAFYHGMLPGFLMAMPDYTPKSNRESGNGRPDIALIPYDEEAPVVLMELKVCKRFSKIIKYGICFCEKTCRVERDK